jgi:hypothetical protein
MCNNFPIFRGEVGAKILDKMEQLISEVIQPNIMDTIKNVYTLMCLLEEDIDPCRITLKGTEVLPRLPEDRLFIVTLTSEVLQCTSEEELRDLISFIIMRTDSRCKGLLALAQAVNLLEGYDKTFDV